MKLLLIQAVVSLLCIPLVAASGGAQAGEGDVCKMKWNSAASKFQEINDNTYKCVKGYTCLVDEATLTDADGLCVAESCGGHNGHDSGQENEESVSAESNRNEAAAE